jgi:YD repeat-containing protein
MSRLHRLAALATLFAGFATLLLAPQTATATPIGGDPPTCACCTCSAGGGSSVCPCEQDYDVSLTEGNVGEDYPVAPVQSAFGATMDFSLMYNSYNADGTRASLDTMVGYGWTHSYNDFLFSQGRDMFRMRGDGRVVRYALSAGGRYQTSPGYFETLVKNSDGSFDVTTKYQTDYHYESIPNTPFLVRGPVFRVTSITDRNGNTTLVGYTNGDLTSITDTYGRSFTLGYNGSHHLISVTTPAGDTTTLAYNSTGVLLASIQDPTGHMKRYSYNYLYQMTSKVDRDGRQFTLLYRYNLPYSELDGAGHPLYTLTNTSNWATDPLQLAQNFMRVYIPSTTSKTDGRGNVWQYPYDSNAHPLKVIAPDGATTTYTYDPGTLQVASMTDADGHPPTTFTYDAEGNLLTRTDALGHVTTYTYDSHFNQMLSMTDPQNRVTTYTIDSHGNRLSETDPLHGARQWTYDSHGNVLTDTDKDGNTTTYTYDQYGNRTQATDALGDLTKYTYDSMGDKTSMTDADGNVTTYQYNALYRLVLETNALNGMKHYFYDGEGDKIEFIDENGHPTSYTYDLRRRLVTITDALGGLITYTYDGNNNKVSMTDQNGHTTQYAYDVQNRLTRTTDALGDTSTRSYDPVGNLISETDANGHTTTLHLDHLHLTVRRIGLDCGS